MVRRWLAVLVLVSVVVMFAGCVMPNGAVFSPIAITKSPVAMGDPSAGATKTGTAQCEGILFMAFGDSSITTAAANGGITKIHHVDSEEINVLGIYCRQITKVYGE